MLRVVGVADDRIHRRLLTEKQLNFNQARHIALTMESADKKCSQHSSQLRHHCTHTAKYKPHGKRKKWKTKFSIWRQALSGLLSLQDCNFCQKTGHISVACLKRKGTKGTKNLRIHKVDRDKHDDDTHTHYYFRRHCLCAQTFLHLMKKLTL